MGRPRIHHERYAQEYTRPSVAEAMPLAEDPPDDFTEPEPIVSLDEPAWLAMSALDPRAGMTVLLKRGGDELAATWKRSRRFVGGRWEPYGAWLVTQTRTPIDFEPQAWRPYR